MTTTEGPGRGDRSRAAILGAARARFAEQGYARTTIRAVARDVGIDPAMVMRYFGDKERLFAAAAEIDLGFAELTDVPRDRLGAALARHFFDQWERGDSAQLLRALLRTAVEDGAAAERLRQVFAAQVHVAAGDADVDPARDVRGAMIAAAILGFALSRYVVKIPAVESLPEGDAVAWLGPSIQYFLDRPA